MKNQLHNNYVIFKMIKIKLFKIKLINYNKMKIK